VEEKPKIRIYGKSASDEKYMIFVEYNGMGLPECRIYIPCFTSGMPAKMIRLPQMTQMTQIEA